MNQSLNQINILRPPKKSLTSVVIVNESLPFSEKFHTELLNLTEISDIIFVFTKQFVQVNNYRVDYRKLTNLYSGYGYFATKDYISKSIIKVIEYDIEISNLIKRRFGQLIVNGCGDEINLNTETTRKIIELNNSAITSAVIKINRLSSDEFSRIYMTSEKSSNFNRFKIKCLNFLDNIGILDISNQSKDNFWCRYGSRSNLVYLNTHTTNAIIQQLDILDNFQTSRSEYLDSFVWGNPMWLISSLIKLGGIKYINCDVEELDFNKITT